MNKVLFYNNFNNNNNNNNNNNRTQVEWDKYKDSNRKEKSILFHFNLKCIQYNIEKIVDFWQL